MPAAPEGRLLAHGSAGRPWVARDDHGDFQKLLLDLLGSSPWSFTSLDDPALPRWSRIFFDDYGRPLGSYLLLRDGRSRTGGRNPLKHIKGEVYLHQNLSTLGRDFNSRPRMYLDTFSAENRTFSAETLGRFFALSCSSILRSFWMFLGLGQNTKVVALDL